jgi:hypothetical protein
MVQLRKVWAAVAVLVAAGCSSSGPRLYTVTGKVTFENEPVKEGRITFKMGGPSGKGYSAEIKDGSYSAQVEPGKAVVEITASRLIPGKFDTSNGTKEPVGEMYIPGKYNVSTSLSVEIKPETNTFPFDLKK